MLRQFTEEYRQVREWFACDFYVLENAGANNEGWCAVQYDRPEKGDGMVMVFRHEHSRCTEASYPLHLNPTASYRFVDLNTHEIRELSAEELKRAFLSEYRTRANPELSPTPKLRTNDSEMRIMHLQPVQAGESRGVGDAPRRGHTVRQSRSERRWETVTGGYGQFAFLCTGSCLRCRKNDFFGICGGGMVSHILRYHFAPFIRFEMIRKERAPLREVFLRSGAFSYHFLEYCKGCYTDIWYVIFACGDKYLMVTIT